MARGSGVRGMTLAKGGHRRIRPKANSGDRLSPQAKGCKCGCELGHRPGGYPVMGLRGRNRAAGSHESSPQEGL